MRKDVLISLLAITGAPVAALADADVVIDKTAWTGDDLTVSEDGSVTVSTGKEVSIEKELAPGKYMLQRATFTDNAKIVAVYKGKEYAPGVAFTIDSDAPAKVKVKVRAVTPGEFKFSGVKFTLIFDFAAPVKELGAQLGEIVSGTSDYFRRTDAWTKGKDGKPSLEMQVADYASQLDIIEKGDYEVYVKNHLWQGKNSPELRALTDGIAALAKVVEKANDNENAYFSAQITTSFKRMALMMVLAISGTLSVLAGNRLVLNDGGPIAIKPGETKEITVNLVNDEVIYAMQFDMDFTSPNVEIVPGSFKINEERIDRECFIATMIQQPDMKWRIALLTKDFTPIAGTEGALGTFKIRATSTFSAADNAQIWFSTCSGGDRQGKKVLIDCPNYQAITPMVGSLCTGEQAFSIKPGGTHKVDVVLKNDIYFCGLQADITLPEGLHIEKKSNGKMNFQYSERLSSNFAISSGVKNGIVRVALSSLPIDKIQPYKDGDGVIFSFNVVADPDFATNETSAIVFSNVLAANETTEYSLDITDAHVTVTSLKAINEAAYARLTEEVAALQKALDDAKAKVAEDCPDVAENFAETVKTIQAQIDAIQSDLDAKNADCALTETSTLDAEAVKGVNEAIAKYINEAAAAQAEHLKKLANEAAYVRLTEEVATVQARFDEVKATIEKDYVNVAAQFADAEAAIQGDIDQKKAELQAQYEAVELDENSTIDLEAIKAAIEQLLADAKVADAKLVANEAAYVRLSDEIAAVQARLDEVKATIEKDYAIVAAQFVGVESSIQYDINKKKDELKALYEAVELDENSTIDLETIKTAIEQLLADAKAAAEANSIGSIQRMMSEGATFYTLGGQKVEAPCKGNIYMIRHADGSVKKVYIK